MLIINVRKIFGVLLILLGVIVVAFAPMGWDVWIKPDIPHKWFETVNVYDSQNEQWESVSRPIASIGWAYLVSCTAVVVGSFVFGIRYLLRKERDDENKRIAG